MISITDNFCKFVPMTHSLDTPLTNHVDLLKYPVYNSMEFLQEL